MAVRLSTKLNAMVGAKQLFNRLSEGGPLDKEPVDCEDVNEESATEPEFPSCNICNDLDFTTTYKWDSESKTSKAVKWPWELYCYIEDLSGSAMAGCDGCSLLWSGILHFISDEEILQRGHVEACMSEERDFCRIEVARYDEEEQEFVDPVTLEFFQARGVPYPWPAIGLGEPTPGDNSSNESLQWARRSIDECVESHEACDAVLESPLPNRILELGDMEVLDADVKILETHNEPATYACLSYCWGSSQTILTEKATLEKRKEGIAWSSLPKTYQDTIHFLKRLGIPYLWIDSLCIIQDSKDDWQRESAQMADIYSNAFLTLAAATAASTQSGCYSTEVPKDAFSVAGTTKKGKDYIVFVRQPHSHFVEDEDEEKFPLFGRGWVQQEHVLSKRVLAFGDQELVWECRSGLSCECACPSFRPNVTGPGGLELANFAPNSLKMSKEELQGFEAQRWHLLVEEYSNKKLSFPSDKLPAFSGITKYWENTYRPGRWLAGLWESSILQDVLWEAGRDSFRSGAEPCRPNVWRAPSWSWASVDGAITFKKFSKAEFECEIDAAECVPAGHDPTGELRSGYLVVSSRLVQTTLVYSQEGFYDDEGNWSVRRSYTCWRESDTAAELAHDYSLEADEENHQLRDGDIVFCLSIGIIHQEDLENHISLALVCLDDENQVYERIGIVEENLRIGSKVIRENMFANETERQTIKII